LPTLDASVIAQGRQVYEQHCATCHGAKAEGAPDWEKPDARGNLPAPPHDTTGHTWRHGDGELHRIIRDGWRDRFNKTPELTMPPFKDKLSDAEMWAVITYFKSLWSEEQRLWQWERSQEMPFPTPAGGGD
jgi:mono/diheme cytochrome c family protein